jgi:hypothetical protein
MKPFRILICIFAASLGYATAQEARQIAPSGVGPAKKYLRAYATPDPEGPTVHCEGDGIDCVATARLLQPRRLTPIHDASLQQATVDVNRILASLESRAPAGKRLCIYRSVRGAVLIWAAFGPTAPSSGAPGRPQAANVSARMITSPEAIADFLKIEFRQVAAGNRKAELIWDSDLKHYVWSCPNAGSDCVIHASFARSGARTVQDEVLAQATQQLNQILQQAAARAPQGKELCLTFLPAGPVLAWTSPTPPPAKPGSRTITAESPEFERAAAQALGLE